MSAEPNDHEPEGDAMRVAVIGGGVIGLIHAAALTRTGHDVVVQSRGERGRSLADKGVYLAEGTEPPVHFRPNMATALPDKLDWILVAVQSGQLDAAVASMLAVDNEVPILTLSNAPRGLAALRERGQGRVVAGFPGAGGFFDSEGVLRYIRIPDQPTTLEATRQPAVATLVQALKKAGFSVTLQPRMDDWLKTHAVFICGLGAAVVRAGGCEALAADRRAVADMISTVREGFRALSATGVSPRPLKLPLIFSWMPRLVSEPFWTQKLTTPAFTVGLAPHVLGASTEMAAMAHDVRSLFGRRQEPMPHLDRALSLLENRAA